MSRVTVEALNHLVNLSFSPTLRSSILGAFAYGSAAIKQAGEQKSKSQLDLVLVVENAKSWHRENLKINPSHYSKTVRFLGNENFIEQLMTLLPKTSIFYNTLIPNEDSSGISNTHFKYGVIDYKLLLQDCESWKYLYCAGRLHKPVTWFIMTKPSLFTKALRQNLASAVAYILITKKYQSPVTLEQLYKDVASISYSGDPRMSFGEDKKKIESLVKGNDRLELFNRLYSSVWNWPHFSDHLYISNEHVTVNPNQLSSLLNFLPTTLAESEGSVGSLEQRLQKIVFTNVKGSAEQQAMLALMTTDLGKVFSYSFAKIRKMLHL
ncbi:hypothetical protein Ciccas_008578 [Cichlidogyrus casuarinus]|uniref:Phosphatidate cytidylyltransferase, mitochondrial n=1 Tax=Cichlidogyrus casuarinus TaxID=1844966 RepID=A0ABD2PZP6_9PLAT